MNLTSFSMMLNGRKLDVKAASSIENAIQVTLDSHIGTGSTKPFDGQGWFVIQPDGVGEKFVVAIFKEAGLELREDTVENMEVLRQLINRVAGRA